MGGSNRRRKQRGSVRKSHSRPKVPDFVEKVAQAFAAERALPNSEHVRTPMRDLKGWLAGLLRIDVLPLWVRSVSALSYGLKTAQDLKYRSEHFTRTVLRIVLDRDRDRSQSIDTTLRRQCCIDRRKSGLTFMKILVAMCAAFDFSLSTSRCFTKSYLGVSSTNANLWALRYQRVVNALKDIRMCVKNDSASADLVSFLTDPRWGQQLAILLSKDHHKICSTSLARDLAVPCAMVEGGEEMRVLSNAICNAVVSASPASPAGVPIPRIFFSNTMENDPLCMASLMMPYNSNVAITLVDKCIGLDRSQFFMRRNHGMPIEIHREIRIFEAIRARIPNNSQAISQVMAAFAKVFKFNRPPLLWWPQQHEIDQITQLAANRNGVAMTVWGLMMEHMALLGLGSNKARALEMYTKSGDNGDIFGLTHAGKILLDGGDGVERDPKKAEAFLWHGANKKIRGALSVLGDLYCGGGEPEIARNDSIAAKMFEAAADLGCVKAARNLAYMVEYGIGGLPKDKERAITLRCRAAQKEQRKRVQKKHLTAAIPMYAIPDPDFILSMSDCSSDSEPSVSTQLTENAPQMLNQYLEKSESNYEQSAPLREDEKVGRRRFRECDVEIAPAPRTPPSHMPPSTPTASNPASEIDELLDIAPTQFNVGIERPCATPATGAANINPFAQFAQRYNAPQTRRRDYNHNNNNNNHIYTNCLQPYEAPQHQFDQYAQQNLQFLASNADCLPKRQRTGYNTISEVWR